MAFCSFHENLGNSICTSFYLDTQKHSPEVFCKKSVLKNFANFTEKHQYWSLFLIKLQGCRSATLIKRDSNTDVFL